MSKRALKGKKCLIIYNEYSSDRTSYGPFREDSIAEDRTEIRAVAKALRSLGVRIAMLGIVRVTGATIRHIEEAKPAFVFNLCEAMNYKSIGEMHVAAMLELLGIPYTGSPPPALALGLDKQRTKTLLAAEGIKTPHGVVVHPEEKIPIRAVTFPSIVKPATEDGSSGVLSVSVVTTPLQLARQVARIHKQFRQGALVEEFIDGREYTISVFEDNKKPRVLAVSETDFSTMPEGTPRIISYPAKWYPRSPLFRGSRIVYPAAISAQLKNRLEHVALTAFRAIGCRDYARLDTRVPKNGVPYFIEINPNPDVAPESGFGAACAVAGITYTDFIATVAGNALRRRH